MDDPGWSEEALTAPAVEWPYVVADDEDYGTPPPDGE
jgi:hypothetical protein